MTSSTAAQQTGVGPRAPPLLQAQGDEAGFAVRIGHEQHRDFLALTLELIEPALEVGRVADALILHFDDHIARRTLLVGGPRRHTGIDPGDDHAFDVFPHLVLLAQIVGQARQLETERLLYRGLRRLRVVLVGRVGCRLLTVLEPADFHPAGFFLALADDDDFDFLADRRVSDDARQVVHFLHVMTVELDHDVAGLDAARFGRPPVVDPGNQRAMRRLDVEAFGDVVGDLLDPHAEPAAAGLAVLAQLVEHRHRRVRRHRKADAYRAAGRRNDRGVHADDFAVEIEQRTAGIAAINGGVGLDVIVVRPRIDVTVARRHDAGRHGAAKAERVADGDYPFAEPKLVGIAELHRLQRVVGLHPQQSEVAL